MAVTGKSGNRSEQVKGRATRPAARLEREIACSIGMEHAITRNVASGPYCPGAGFGGAPGTVPAGAGGLAGASGVTGAGGGASAGGVPGSGAGGVGSRPGTGGGGSAGAGPGRPVDGTGWLGVVSPAGTGPASTGKLLVFGLGLSGTNRLRRGEYISS